MIMIEYVFSTIASNQLAFVIGIICGMLFELAIVLITEMIDQAEKKGKDNA